MNNNKVYTIQKIYIKKLVTKVIFVLKYHFYVLPFTFLVQILKKFSDIVIYKSVVFNSISVSKI